MSNQSSLSISVLSIFVVILVAVSALPHDAAENSSAEWVRPIFEEVGVIEITDPMMVIVGAAAEGENTLELSLVDVAKYSGHVCGGIASGYVITKTALEKLYPEATPVRGQITVTASAPNDLLDVASYITGARAFYGRAEVSRDDLKVDPALAGPGEVVIVFRRKDTGRAVKVVWSKKKLLSVVKDQKLLMATKAKVEDHSATPEEKKAFGIMVQQVVDAVLDGTIVPFTVEVVGMPSNNNE